MAVARSSRKVFQSVKRKLMNARDYWRNDNDRHGRLLAECLFLQHYVGDNPLTKDRRRIQPKTLKQFNLARHKASLLLRQMPQFDTHAVQPGADAGAAEISARVINNIFLDPLKGYHDYRSRWVWSMLAAERGVIAIDWHPRWGVCFRLADARRVHITPGFTFLHDVRNPGVSEEIPMRMSEVRKMKAAGWDIPSDLEADGGLNDYGEGGDRNTDGIERDQSSHIPGDDSDPEDGIVTICKYWSREDPYRSVSSALENADLPEQEWHFVDDQTGQTVPFDPMNPVAPPSQVTGQPMRLVTSEGEKYKGHEYEEGYLCIIAPNYAGEKPLFEGKWTEGAINKNATLSAFPYMELTTYKHPLRRSGISDTELTHSNVIMDNSVTRSAFEQSRMTGGLLITQPGGLKDSEGNQYQFKDLPMDIAYADDLLTQESVKFFQAQGMNPTTPTMMQLIDQKWQDIGTGDFSANLGPERSKDIAVGTANLLQQTGDLPVQLHQQDMNLQEAIGGRVALDYCRAYMGDQVISWVTEQPITLPDGSVAQPGEMAYAHVRGEDLVPLNVTVLVGKEWRQQDTDKMQAVAQMLGQAGKLGLPPQVIPILLRGAGLPSDVTTALAEAMAQQAPPANAPPQPGGPPALSVVQGGSPQ
jgi:hypothetical protein